MMTRHDVTKWLRRQLRGLGSLLAASTIVLAVMSYALFSMLTSDDGTPARPGSAGTLSAGVETALETVQEKMPSLYIRATTDHPLLLTAEIEIHGWKDRGQRIIDTQISRVESAATERSSESRAVAYPEGQITEQLSGQRVLASVSVDAAKRIPESGKATVALVVTPAGDTATLVIDEVITPAVEQSPEQTILAASQSGAMVIRAATSSGISAAATTRVKSLSRYWGPPGTKVTMTGSGFGRTMGSNWVTCAGSKARVVSWSDTKIVFRVPKGMKKQGYIGVVKSKKISNGLYFSPFGKPVIAAITPREGAPGTNVTLKGSGFGTKQSDGWVTFAGSTAQVISWSDTAIKVIVPRGAASGYAGVVAHGMTSNGVLYGPLGAPLVTSISAPVLLPDRTVSIMGRGFGSRTGTVVVGGIRVTPEYWSPTEVRFKVACDLPSGYVGVIRADAWTSNGVWVPWAPRLASVSRWWTRPLEEVTLTGVGFGDVQGDRHVFMRGTELTVKSWSDERIVVIAPEIPSSGYVGVGTRSACSNGIYLVVERPATIESASTRAVKAGEPIVIEGADFGSPTSTSKVVIGGVVCAVESWSDSKIVVRAPSIATTAYLGVVKNGVASNGVWVTPADAR